MTLQPERSFDERLASLSVWVLLPLWFVTYITLQIVARFAPLPHGLGLPFRTTVAGGAVMTWCLVAIARRTKDARSIFRTMPDRAGWALIPPLIVAVLVVRLAWVYVVYPAIFDALGTPLPAPEPKPVEAPIAVALRWFTAVFFLPLVEEVVFRGVLFRKWRARFGAENAAWWSTLAFMVFHQDAVGVLIAGITTVLLYTRTRALVACLIVHCSNNAVVQLLNIDGQASLRAAISTHPFVTLAFAALSAAWLVWFVRKTWPTLGVPLPPDPVESAATRPRDSIGARAHAGEGRA